MHGGIAQWLEQSAHNRLVAGSNPAAPTKSMKNAFRVFFVDLFLVFTGRESEVRANKEPSENADLFAIFWGDAVKQGFSLEKLLPSKAH